MKKKLFPQKDFDQDNFALNKYFVEITNLILDAKIGIHNHEKITKQPIRINIKINISPAIEFSDDSIKNVIDYEKIVNGVKNLLNQEHTNLVEVLAQKIAKLCLSYKMAESVILKIEKLDIIKESESVGIETEFKKTYLIE